jgi:hypothetical protein
VIEHLDFTGCKMDEHAAKLTVYMLEKTTSIKQGLSLFYTLLSFNRGYFSSHNYTTKKLILIIIYAVLLVSCGLTGQGLSSILNAISANASIQNMTLDISNNNLEAKSGTILIIIVTLFLFIYILFYFSPFPSLYFPFISRVRFVLQING